MDLVIHSAMKFIHFLAAGAMFFKEVVAIPIVRECFPPKAEYKVHKDFELKSFPEEYLRPVRFAP